MNAFTDTTRQSEYAPCRVAVLCADQKSIAAQKWANKFIHDAFDNPQKLAAACTPDYITQSWKDPSAPGRHGVDAFAHAQGPQYDIIISEGCGIFEGLVRATRAALENRLKVGGAFLAYGGFSAERNVATATGRNSGK